MIFLFYFWPLNFSAFETFLFFTDLLEKTVLRVFKHADSFLCEQKLSCTYSASPFSSLERQTTCLKNHKKMIIFFFSRWESFIQRWNHKWLKTIQSNKQNKSESKWLTDLSVILVNSKIGLRVIYIETFLIQDLILEFQHKIRRCQFHQPMPIVPISFTVLEMKLITHAYETI